MISLRHLVLPPSDSSIYRFAKKIRNMQLLSDLKYKGIFKPNTMFLKYMLTNGNELPWVSAFICTFMRQHFYHNIAPHEWQFSWHLSNIVCVKIGCKIKPVGCFIHNCQWSRRNWRIFRSFRDYFFTNMAQSCRGGGSCNRLRASSGAPHMSSRRQQFYLHNIHGCS